MVQAAEPERKAVRDQAPLLFQAAHFRTAVHRQEEEGATGKAGCQKDAWAERSSFFLADQAQVFLQATLAQEVEEPQTEEEPSAA